MRTLLLLSVTGLTLLGCNSNKSEPENVTPNELQRVMAADGNPNFDQLTAKLLAKQPAVEGLDYAKAIADLTPDHGLDPWATKVEVDSRLTARNGGVALLYNRDFVSLDGPLTKGRMQCFSGSMLNLLVQRQKTQAEFNRANPVMIFTAGHILPGYVLKEDAGYRLVGAETTVTGRGRTDFGLTKDLTRAIRVVDAEAFVQMYVYQSKLKDVPAMVAILLKQTADRYAIPLARTEATMVKGELTIAADAPLNRSAFGFGSERDISEAGDIVRAQMDEIVPKDEYSNRTVISGEALGAPSATSAVSPLKHYDFRSMWEAPLERKLFPKTPAFELRCAQDRDLLIAKQEYLRQVEEILSELPEGGYSVESAPDLLNAAGARLGLGDARCIPNTNECVMTSRTKGRERQINYFQIQFRDGMRTGFQAYQMNETPFAMSYAFELRRDAEGTTMSIRVGDQSVLWKGDRILFPVQRERMEFNDTHAEPSLCSSVKSSEKVERYASIAN